MARKQCIWFPNAMYHITNRGARKMTVFYDEKDYLKYLEILEQTRERFPFWLHSYCLMSNHIHLQMQTINDPIYKIMKQLNSYYAKYFNLRYDLVGHVFQGRYGAELIDSVEYELDVSKYIHLNPVEAHIVDKPEEYRWSSYRAYVFGEKNKHVHTKKILSHFVQPASSNYEKFVKEQDKPPDPPEIIENFAYKFNRN